ncbi:hypothetical protein B0H17DRAFT_1138527 [Mycena rosella]|uniref:Uncharacterized protein n=1 Tax=Mycena rosella TaxID=1033263 RepID=A0AAD7D9U3_MYCRO|nr:hypothetical protein B0H17DRAFT_1138527 [Mycena rosella]
MTICQFVRRLLFRKARPSRATTLKKGAVDSSRHLLDVSKRTEIQSIGNPDPSPTPDALKSALETLSSEFRNTALDAVLSDAVRSLMDATYDVNVGVAHSPKLSSGSWKLLTKDLGDEGDLSSCLERHTKAFDQIIAHATCVLAHEAQRSMSISKSQIELGDIAGGTGGVGGSACIGGVGGDGQGPNLELTLGDCSKIVNVSGGIGGPGGDGVDVGGKEVLAEIR